MSSLQERLDARLTDIDSQILRVKALAEAEIAKLDAQRAQLTRAAKLITPEIEATVAGLRVIGVLGENL